VLKGCDSLNYRIPVARPDIGDAELNNVIEAVNSGWVSSKGAFIEEFEMRFAQYIGVKHAIAVSNGTAALHLALAALGVTRRHEVIVPSLTFIAAANAVTYVGATPVFTDSSEANWCMDPEDAGKRVTPKTRAILPVHLYGHPCDMDPILETSHANNLCVVEDCAEAHGAEYKGGKVGCFGDVACFSFYGNKIITTGEGGMCLTNDEEIADKIKILRDHGMNPKKRYWHDIVGFNYRMTNLQAALGVAQIGKIERLLERKREIAKAYRELLNQTKGIVHAPEMVWAKNSYWFYSVLVEGDRDKTARELADQGVETRPFFYPIHTLPPYSRRLDLRVAERLSRQGLNLPSGPIIKDDEIQYVATALQKAL
jgi:perosamine synthetase